MTQSNGAETPKFACSEFVRGLKAKSGAESEIKLQQLGAKMYIDTDTIDKLCNVDKEWCSSAPTGHQNDINGFRRAGASRLEFDHNSWSLEPSSRPLDPSRVVWKSRSCGLLLSGARSAN